MSCHLSADVCLPSVVERQAQLVLPFQLLLKGRHGLPFQVGGMGDVVTALGRAVQEEGHKVEVILPKYDCIQYDEVQSPKHDCIECNKVVLPICDCIQKEKVGCKQHDKLQCPSMIVQNTSRSSCRL